MDKRNEQEERIKEFLTEMVNQDNLGTAFPIFFVIKTERFHYTATDEFHEEFGDVSTAYSHPDCFEGQPYDSREEIVNELKEANYNDWKKLDKNIQHWSKFRYWEDEGLFLTSSSAKHHLESNRHHYSKNAHVYCKHAWRSHPLESFLLHLIDYFKIEGEVKK